jgi:hypothetical protein
VIWRIKEVESKDVSRDIWNGQGHGIRKEIGRSGHVWSGECFVDVDGGW